MKVRIFPGTLRGTTAAPPSKSMAHRMLICAALAEGESFVRPVELSEDILATADCLRALGAEIRQEGEGLRVLGCRPREAKSAVLNCRESGSTLRFLLPVCLLSGKEMRLTGSGRLMERPMDVYEALCREKNFRMEKGPDGITVQGRLTAGNYTVPGHISSQFATGLLFALSLTEGASEVRILPPVESGSYLDMTIQALQENGIRTERPDPYTIRILPGGKFIPGEKTVEGDWSNAAFFEAMNNAGGEVRVTGLKEDSLQGDRVCREILRRFLPGQPEDDGIGADVTDCPDLAPVLMAAAAMRGGARLTGTRRLRFKESDRGAAMAEELAKFGIPVENCENEIRVGKAALQTPREILQGHNDHRIVMALAVLCTRTGGVIEGAEAVRKSFPDFWNRMRALGARLETEEGAEA